MASNAQASPEVDFDGNVLCFAENCYNGALRLLDVSAGEPLQQGRFEVLEFEVEVAQQPRCNFVLLNARVFTLSGAQLPPYPGGLMTAGSELQEGGRYIMSIKFPRGTLSRAGKISVWPKCTL